MKTKPWIIFILALIHILAPLGNLLANSMRSGRPLPEQVNYWFNILPKHLLIIYLFVPILAGAFILICRRWSYWGYLACLAILFASNIYAYITSTTLANFIFLCVALVVDLLIVAYFVVPSVRKVYFDPRVRWWETAMRYVYTPTVTINGQTPGQMNNISAGGLFVQTTAALTEGDKIQVQWSDEGENFDFNGRIVYINPKTRGFGVQFEHTADSEKSIKKLTQKLHKKGLVIPDRLPGPDDSFAVWLKKLATRGEGLFPKT